MKGIEIAFVQNVKETLKFLDALCENLDNAIEHCRSEVRVYIDYNGDSIVISNDGKPISHLNEIVGNFTAHIDQTSDADMLPISYFGVGFKKAFLKLCDSDNGSVLNIYSRHKQPDVTFVASISYDGENIKESYQEMYVGDVDKVCFDEGTTFEIKGLDKKFWNVMSDVDSDDKNKIVNSVLSQFYQYVSERYGEITKRKGISIYINDEKVRYTDYPRLGNLGELKNVDGVHYVNGIIYNVHTYFPEYKGNRIQFKMISTYIPRNVEEELEDELVECPFTGKLYKRGDLGIVGVWTERGGRYMDIGGNVKAMFTDALNMNDNGQAIYHRGGCNRIRYVIFTDGNLEFFKITSNKTNEYNILTKEQIEEHCISVTEGKGGNKSNKTSKAKKNAVTSNNDGILDVSEILSMKVDDKVAEMIENCSLFPECVKHSLYGMYDDLKKPFEEIIRNFIKNAEDYESTKTDNPTKAA